MKKVLTLCIIYKDSRVLLGMKKRGFGAGKWNGFGGKVQENETVEDAMRREVREEAGISLGRSEKMGILEFEFFGNPEILEVHVFGASEFEDEPVETEEMKPQWFLVHEIPFDLMWPDDRHWFPIFLEGKKFKGKFFFGAHEAITSFRLELVHSPIY